MGAPAKQSAFADLILTPEHIERWLRKHHIPLAAIEEGRPCWPGKTGMLPLTVREIEWMIGREDPVAWGYLNLTERQTITDDDGEVVIRAGDPWSLFPIQARMARLTGNWIFECGAEVGKTRDIVVGTLWEADCCSEGDSSLVAADSDTTLEEIWNEIEFQLEQNPAIGGGVIKTQLKPFKEKVFARGTSFQMRLCGHNGKQFRGGHYNRTVRADEAAMWKNLQQWNELWRAAKPGCSFRIYSTPDGDYSSPFYAMCDRAIPADGRKEEPKKKGSKASDDEPKFRKLNISKRQLPPPFWTERRYAQYLEQFGGESSVGFLTNVEGKWGSPSYSVFPMPTLRPNLKFLPWYRIVVATIDRERGDMAFSAARLSPELEHLDGNGQREEILARERIPLSSGHDLGQAIARFFPEIEVKGWTAPRLFCGADLGSAQDPSEFIFIRELDRIWIDVFRLHLASADWPIQATVVTHLDHASGHQVRYAFDAGSAGSALAQVLTQGLEYSSCPVCQERVYFGERLEGHNFADRVDEIDPDTGEVKFNPDKRDAAGDPQPARVSNKEFSTRVLERKAQAVKLQIAWDAGAGNNKLSGPQLLVNHTAEMSPTGERRFKGKDDHHVDSRRQAALAITRALRSDVPDLTRAGCGSSSPRQTATVFAGFDRVEASTVSAGLQGFGAGGSLRGGLR